MLSDILVDSKLYRQSSDYMQLLEFVARLRGFSPFNAMLLHIQKPGLSYAATLQDWKNRFSRYPKPEARPLLILQTFGPVSFVFDVIDTEGKSLPEDVKNFVAKGSFSESRLTTIKEYLSKKNIEVSAIDVGDRLAGSIRIKHPIPTNGAESRRYAVQINLHHSSAVQFCTLVHELGHLFLGHLGVDANLKVKDRRYLNHTQQEIEAESVCYIVCQRMGVVPKSQPYLASFVTENTTVDDIDIHEIMRTTTQLIRVFPRHEQTNFKDSR